MTMVVMTFAVVMIAVRVIFLCRGLFPRVSAGIRFEFLLATIAAKQDIVTI